MTEPLDSTSVSSAAATQPFSNQQQGNIGLPNSSGKDFAVSSRDSYLSESNVENVSHGPPMGFGTSVPFVQCSLSPVEAAMAAQQVNAGVAEAVAQTATQIPAASAALPPQLQALVNQLPQHFGGGFSDAHQPQQLSQRLSSCQLNVKGSSAVECSNTTSSACNDSSKENTAVSYVSEIEEWAVEPLFGGAMEMDLPLRLSDISKVRPVPDHQEVFADVYQDQSLVVEILEMANVDNEQSAKFFFEDLALQNEAETRILETMCTLDSSHVPNIPSGCVCTSASGYQTISKGNQSKDSSNTVQIILAVIRLPEVKCDIVVSLNTPVFINENSASAEHAGAGLKIAFKRAPELFRRMLKSLKIRDMGLFGSG